ncbi:hypothetical protein RCH19_002686 [Flavobacterium sp. PL12]
MFKTLFLLLFTTLCFSQTKILVGVVSDNINKPLESATVITKPLQEKANLNFSTADNKRCNVWGRLLCASSN